MVQYELGHKFMVPIF
uniref:Uncharacterized protein n=1 Tax=Arundo donax TaxID=35708 RepID=A0A0A8YIU6_ARUDO